jgi:hypothetical protein
MEAVSSKQSDETGSTRQRRIVGIAALVACLLIGGGIVYLLAFGDRPGKRTVKRDDPPAPTAKAPLELQDATAPQAAQAKTSATIRAHHAELSAGTRREGGYRINIYHFKRDYLSDEEHELVTNLFRLRRDAAYARELGISDAQLARIRKMPVRGEPMTLTSAQREELEMLWQSYITASGPAATQVERKLIAKVDEVAKDGLPQSRASFMKDLEAIKKILTAEQITALSKR